MEVGGGVVGDFGDEVGCPVFLGAFAAVFEGSDFGEEALENVGGGAQAIRGRKRRSQRRRRRRMGCDDEGAGGFVAGGFGEALEVGTEGGVGEGEGEGDAVVAFGFAGAASFAARL